MQPIPPAHGSHVAGSGTAAPLPTPISDSPPSGWL
jgi:hypothetical protein